MAADERVLKHGQLYGAFYIPELSVGTAEAQPHPLPYLSHIFGELFPYCLIQEPVFRALLSETT